MSEGFPCTSFLYLLTRFWSNRPKYPNKTMHCASVFSGIRLLYILLYSVFVLRDVSVPIALCMSSSQAPHPLSRGERAAGVLRGGNQSQSSAADCHDFSLNFHLPRLRNTGSSFLLSIFS